MTVKTPKISIIIVNYNGKDYLENCLSSIFKTEYQNFEVIVVDNASTDGSVQQIRQKFPTTKIIFNKKNLGSAGRNSGIVHAQGEFVVLLDSDTIVSPNWLSEFMAAFEKKGYGMYQGKLLFMDQPNKINSAGCMLNIFGFSYARGSGEIDKAQYDKSEKINFTSGACTFLPRSVFEKVGLFDLNFFAYVEDTDFVCIQGKVVFIAKNNSGKYIEIESSEENPVMVHIPKNLASAHINSTNEIAIVLALANPAWRPDDSEMKNILFEDYDWEKWKK